MSPVDTHRIDIPSLAEDLNGLLVDQGIRRAVLLGHSMGVQVSLETAHRYPQNIIALGLLCGSPGRVTHTFHGNDLLAQHLPKLIGFSTQKAPIVRALWGFLPTKLSFVLAKFMGEVDKTLIKEHDFQMYMSHLTSIDPLLYFNMLKAAGEHDAEPYLNQIAVPTLVVAAEKDTFTPSELAKKMAESIPNAAYLFLSRASHAAPVEQPEMIIQHLDLLFKKCI